MKILSLLIILASTAMAAVAPNPPNSSEELLAIDGQIVPIQYSSGGYYKALIAEQNLGNSNFPKKSVTRINLDPLFLSLNLAGSTTVFDLVKNYFEGNGQAKNFSTLITDFNNKVLTEKQYSNGSLVSVVFPVLNAQSKEFWPVGLGLASERMVILQNGSAVANPGKPAKRPIASNFRVSIDGIGDLNVSRVEEISVNRFTNSNVGNPAAGSYKISNIKMTISNTRNNSALFSWYEDFFINGNNKDSNEKKMQISLLAPDLKTELFNLFFDNVGFVSYSLINNGSAIEIELYAERIHLK